MVESPTFGERTMEHPESHGSSMWSPFYDYKMHISIPSDPPVGQVTSTLETGVPLPSEDERNEALFAVFSVLGSVRKWVFPVFCCNIEREYMYLCTYVSLFLSLSILYIYTHICTYCNWPVHRWTWVPHVRTNTCMVSDLQLFTLYGILIETGRDEAWPTINYQPPPCTWWKVRWESSHNWRVFQDFSGLGFLFVVVMHPFDDWGEVWITQPKNCACEAATAEAAWPTTNEVFTHRGNWRRQMLCLNQWTRRFYRFDSPQLGDQRIIGTSSPNKNSVLVQYPPWLQTPGFHRPGCCRKPQTVPGRWEKLGMDGQRLDTPRWSVGGWEFSLAQERSM